MTQLERDNDLEFQTSLGAAVDAISRRLTAAGVKTPREDARRLVAAATGCDPIDFIANPERQMSVESGRLLAGYVARRVRREPVSKVLGVREFYGRSFDVNPATLDPRADSETLIDAMLELAREEGWQDRPIRMLDIGTGSGCLLVTLLCELPGAVGVATDISEGALNVARRNAERHGVADRAVFELRRSLEDVTGPFDLVVSNPPYIETAAIAGLEPEVRDYDPHGALDGGPDGLAVYREIARSLDAVVRNGWAVFEIGAGQFESVTKILAEIVSTSESQPIRSWRDLNGHTRCVAVRIQRAATG